VYVSMCMYVDMCVCFTHMHEITAEKIRKSSPLISTRARFPHVTTALPCTRLDLGETRKATSYKLRAVRCSEDRHSKPSANRPRFHSIRRIFAACASAVCSSSPSLWAEPAHFGLWNQVFRDPPIHGQSRWTLQPLFRVRAAVE
jgi:hypothetical protein